MLPNLSALRLQQQPSQPDLERNSGPDSDSDWEPGFGDAHMGTVGKSLNKLLKELSQAKLKLAEAEANRYEKKKAKDDADAAKAINSCDNAVVKAAKKAAGELKSAEKAVETKRQKVVDKEKEVEAKKAESGTGPGGPSTKGVGIKKKKPAGTVVVPAAPDPVDAAMERAKARADYLFLETDLRRCVTRDIHGMPVRYLHGIPTRPATTCDNRVSGIDIVKIFNDEELRALRVELRQAVDHMPELKPASGVKGIWSHDAARAQEQELRREYTGVVQDSIFDDPLQHLVGGGFAALGNPGSFHNQFVRRLRRKVQEKVLRLNVFGLNSTINPEANPYQSVGACANASNPTGGHHGKMIEQVIDRMLVRKPEQTPTSESWHRDVAKGTFDDDEVYGGWLNLDPPLGPTPSDEDYQYFSCIPFTAQDAEAKTQTGFAKVAKEVLAAKVERACRVRVPPGYLLVFNEMTIHEVAPTPAKRIMSRVFFGWRLTDPKHHLRTPEDENAGTHRNTIPGALKNQLLSVQTELSDLKYILTNEHWKPTSNRFPCICGLKKRLEEQEGIPLKSGQHPENWQQKPTLVESPNYGTYMFRPESLGNRFKDPENGAWWTEEGTFYDASYTQIPEGKDGVLPKHARFVDYPQGPPNWPRTWYVEQDVRDFLLKFNHNTVNAAKVHDEAGNVLAEGQAVLDAQIKSKGPRRQKWNADVYLTHENAKVYFRGIWADWVPQLTFNWNPDTDKHKTWRDTVKTVANTFEGLKHYERVGLLKSHPNYMDYTGRHAPYPDYTEEEMAIHFPLTFMEACYYLGMLDTMAAENTQRQYHNWPPFCIEPRAYHAHFEGDDTMPGGCQLKQLPGIKHLQQRGRARLGSKRCYDEARSQPLCVEDNYDVDDVYEACDSGQVSKLNNASRIQRHDPS